jgi:hypothetical protein
MNIFLQSAVLILFFHLGYGSQPTIEIEFGYSSMNRTEEFYENNKIVVGGTRNEKKCVVGIKKNCKDHLFENNDTRLLPENTKKRYETFINEIETTFSEGKQDFKNFEPKAALCTVQTDTEKPTITFKIGLGNHIDVCVIKDRKKTIFQTYTNAGGGEPCVSGFSTHTCTLEESGEYEIVMQTGASVYPLNEELQKELCGSLSNNFLLPSSTTYPSALKGLANLVVSNTSLCLKYEHCFNCEEMTRQSDFQVTQDETDPVTNLAHNTLLLCQRYVHSKKTLNSCFEHKISDLDVAIAIIRIKYDKNDWRSAFLKRGKNFLPWIKGYGYYAGIVFFLLLLIDNCAKK